MTGGIGGICTGCTATGACSGSGTGCTGACGGIGGNTCWGAACWGIACCTPATAPLTIPCAVSAIPLNTPPIWPKIQPDCGACAAGACVFGVAIDGAFGAGTPVKGSGLPEALAINFTIHFTIFSKNPSVGATGAAACACGTACTGGMGICTGCTATCGCTGVAASHTRLYGFQGTCAGIGVCIGSIFGFCLWD
jgi:hypothetical protein